MKKNSLGFFAIVLAIGAVAFTTPKSKLTTFYFSFDPVAQGNTEDDELKWVDLGSLANYNAISCNAPAINGCKLQTTAIQTVGSVNYPALVNTSGVNKTPVHLMSDSNSGIVNQQ